MPGAFICSIYLAARNLKAVCAVNCLQDESIARTRSLIIKTAFPVTFQATHLCCLLICACLGCVPWVDVWLVYGCRERRCWCVTAVCCCQWGRGWSRNKAERQREPYARLAELFMQVEVCSHAASCMTHDLLGLFACELSRMDLGVLQH